MDWKNQLILFIITPVSQSYPVIMAIYSGDCCLYSFFLDRLLKENGVVLFKYCFVVP